MKIRLLFLCFVLALLFAGCQLVPDQYVSVVPHAESYPQSAEDEEVVISSYADLRDAFMDLIRKGTEEATLTTGVYSGDIDEDFARLEQFVTNEDPVGAYLVRRIDKEIGRAGAYYKIDLRIAYRHPYDERLETLLPMYNVPEQVENALNMSEEDLLLNVYSYEDTDFAQMVEDYCEDNLTEVMAKPDRVEVAVYPRDGGSLRVVELHFYYPAEAEDLVPKKRMVEDFFLETANRSVSELPVDLDRARQLYAYFINLPHGYSEGESPTPAFTLFFEGKTDSRTFSAVYNKMCADAQVNCTVVHGTKDGEDYDWNILELESGVWHVDVNADALSGSPALRLRTDAEMEGYEWDRDAYPACIGLYEPIVPQQELTDQPGEPEQPEEQTPKIPEEAPEPPEEIPEETEISP